MPPACGPLSLSHWAEAEAVSSFGASHREGYEAVIMPAVLSCRLRPGQYPPCRETFEEGGQKKKKRKKSVGKQENRKAKSHSSKR